jgi:hypothetical protein
MGSVVMAILFSAFVFHRHFLKKKSYSIIATSHILLQLLIVVVCFFVISSTHMGLINEQNWMGFVLFGFLISAIVSEFAYFLEYLKTRPLHLVPVETLLAKSPKNKEDSTASFLRLDGFLWVDFVNGITVKRKETEEIISKLKTDNFVTIIGDQASGKSSILREVGYRLTNNGFIVLFVNADWLDVNLAMADVRNWDMSNVIVIVDDVHRNVSVVSDFLDKVRFNNVRIALSSRPTNFVLPEGKDRRLCDLFEK